MEVLQAQMEELCDQLETLRIGEAPRGQSKDVSLVAGISEWTGKSKGRSVQEFLTQVETLAKVSGWTSRDKALIVKAKLQGLALQFLNGREELGRDGYSYEVLRQALIERFSDKLPDQYYCTRLQDMVQGKDESAEEFSGRCRKMCLRTIRKVNDEETQRIINEEAERKLLTAYVHGLRGIVGTQGQFQMPSTMEQAVRLAVTVENVEKHRQLTDGAKKIFVAKREVECYWCRKTVHYARDCRQEPPSVVSGRRSWGDRNGNWRDLTSRETQFTRGGRGRGGPGSQNFRRPARASVQPEDTRLSGTQCHHCREFGPRHRNGQNLPQPTQYPNSQGLTSRSQVLNPQ
jgi:hypothetical protein